MLLGCCCTQALSAEKVENLCMYTQEVLQLYIQTTVNLLLPHPTYMHECLYLCISLIFLYYLCIYRTAYMHRDTFSHPVLHHRVHPSSSPVRTRNSLSCERPVTIILILSSPSLRIEWLPLFKCLIVRYCAEYFHCLILPSQQHKKLCRKNETKGDGSFPI